MSLEPIVVNFVVGGADRVRQVVGDLQSRMDRANKMGVTSAQRAAAARVKSEEGAARKVIDITGRLEKDKLRLLDKANKERLKLTERTGREELRIKNRINDLEVRDWQRNQRQREQNAGKWGRRAGGALQRTTGMVGRVAAVAATLGGGFTIADSLGKGINREKIAGEIVRNASDRGGMTQTGTVAAARKAAIASGGTSDDILAGLNDFVKKTGDLKAGTDMLDDMAKLAAATGSSFEDLAGAAGEVFTKLRDVGKTKEVMLALAGQGRRGAIDIRDLAAYGARLAGTAGDYAGDKGQNITKLGALAQISKDSGLASDAAEASEAVMRLDTDLTKHAKKMKDGIVYDKGGKKKGIDEILVGALMATKGDERKLIKIFGDRSYKTVSGLRQTFVGAGGGAKGAAAVKAEFEKYGAGAALSKQQVDTDVADRLKETSAKVNRAMEDLSGSINDKLLPKLPGLIDALSNLIPVVTRAVGIFADFPKLSIGGIIAGAVVADIAKAQLGSVVADAIKNQILKTGGGGGGTPGGGGGSSLPGFGGTLLKALPVAATVAEYSQKMSSGIAGGYDKQIGAIVGSAKDLAQNAGPDQADDIRQKMRAIQAEMAGGKQAASEQSMPGGEVIGDLKRTVAAMTGDTSTQDLGERNKAAARNADELGAALEGLKAKLDSFPAVNPATMAPTQPIGARATQ